MWPLSGRVRASLWLGVAMEEDAEDVDGEEGQEDEIVDGRGIVAIDMVGMPGVGEGVESFVLDAPPSMGDSDEI